MRFVSYLMLLVLSGCAALRPVAHRPEDCVALSAEARRGEAWNVGAGYVSLGLGAGTALAEAAKDSKPLTITFALAAVLAGAVSLATGNAAQSARAEWRSECGGGQ
jgi:hypothetical protein